VCFLFPTPPVSDIWDAKCAANLHSVGV
jgi:hypothetical protein